MSELFEISKKFKEQADELLAKTDLTNNLHKYGEVYFTGAYAGNVMMHGDIDITVVRDEPYSKDEIFEVLKGLYFEGKFRSYFIKGGWNDPRMGNEFPNGYYVGLKYRVGNEKWKIDIWFVSREDFIERSKSFSIDKVQLTDEEKELILLFKKYRKDKDLDVPGQVIYKAVLEQECKSIKDFEDFLQNTK
ncbi:MAG: hypothetical protein WC229_00070 [Candidatus Paceibacterota bacterium]|jgi:hypothetical protein